jgi:hypothetical protein
MALGPRVEALPVMFAVVLDAVATVDDVPHQARMGGGPLADAEEAGPGVGGVELVEHPGVISGSGPSSMLMTTSPRAAAAAGRRVRLGPSSVQRGSSRRC